VDNWIPTIQGSGTPSSIKVKMSDVEFLYRSTIDTMLWLFTMGSDYPLTLCLTSD